MLLKSNQNRDQSKLKLYFCCFLLTKKSLKIIYLRYFHSYFYFFGNFFSKCNAFQMRTFKIDHIKNFYVEINNKTFLISLWIWWMSIEIGINFDNSALCSEYYLNYFPILNAFEREIFEKSFHITNRKNLWSAFHVDIYSSSTFTYERTINVKRQQKNDTKTRQNILFWSVLHKYSKCFFSKSMFLF